jgi:hypothetical protein
MFLPAFFGRHFLANIFLQPASSEHSGQSGHAVLETAAGSCRHVFADIFLGRHFWPAVFAGILAGIFARRAHTGSVKKIASVSPL